MCLFVCVKKREKRGEEKKKERRRAEREKKERRKRAEREGEKKERRRRAEREHKERRRREEEKKRRRRAEEEQQESIEAIRAHATQCGRVRLRSELSREHNYQKQLIEIAKFDSDKEFYEKQVWEFFIYLYFYLLTM